MKNKQILLICVIMIAFVVITSYTPKVVQAEMVIQESPVTAIEEIEDGIGPALLAEETVTSTDIDTPDFFELDSSELEGDNQINANKWGFFNAVGINFVAHNSALTYYNDGMGCLRSTYEGTASKTFTIPVNVPHNAIGGRMYFTYWNRIENPGDQIDIALFRRKYDSLTTEKVKEWGLAKDPVGAHFSVLQIGDVTFNTSEWLYWFEFKLPANNSMREFCGIQISYQNPPLFPLAFPTVITKP